MSARADLRVPDGFIVEIQQGEISMVTEQTFRQELLHFTCGTAAQIQDLRPA